MSALTPGMHDDPRIFPRLTPREPDADIAHYAAPDDDWRACWEFVLTHDLDPTEGSAFWHGANLMRQTLKARADIEANR